MNVFKATVSRHVYVQHLKLVLVCSKMIKPVNLTQAAKIFTALTSDTRLDVR